MNHPESLDPVAPVQDHEKEKTTHSTHTAKYEQFLLEMNALDNVEAKLQRALDFMQESLSDVAKVHFKNFWQA